MDRINLIKKAEAIAKDLISAKAQIKDNRGRIQFIDGTDPNEYTKVIKFYFKEKDLKKLSSLIQSLIKSPFARRSNRTMGYYINIERVLKKSDLDKLTYEEASYVLGWTEKLLKYYKAGKEEESPRTKKPPPRRR